jgi:hypothetical protein
MQTVAEREVGGGGGLRLLTFGVGPFAVEKRPCNRTFIERDELELLGY